jgi:HAMP domain-containing protein
MSQAFVVEVTEKPEITPQEAVDNLAKAFNIAPRKIELMLKRLPGVATKPISESEAVVVVTYFEQAGLKALKKPATLPVKTNTATPLATKTPLTPPTTEATVPSTSTDLPSPKTSSEVAKERLERVYKAEEAAQSQSASQAQMASHAEAVKKDELPSEKAADRFPPRPEVPMVKAEPPEDLLRALGEVSSNAGIQPSTSERHTFTTSSYSSAAVLPPPKFEKRTDHDILRTTLIGEPDPRQTLTGQDVYDSSAALPVLASRQRSGGLASKLMFTAIIPVLLTLLGTLVAAYFILQTALNEGMQSSARHPATALAAGLSSVLTETPTGEVDYTRLQESIAATRGAFEALPVSFIAVTDNEGEVLPASWFESNTFTAGQDVRETIQEQALRAISESATSESGVSEAATTPILFGTSGLEIVTRPLRLNNQTVGAVVVGAASGPSDLWQLLGRIALLSLIPLATASLLTMLLTRPLLRRIHYLTQRADEISRGYFSKPVEHKGNDELSTLAEALERTRVSMQGALERLRRKR